MTKQDFKDRLAAWQASVDSQNLTESDMNELLEILKLGESLGINIEIRKMSADEVVITDAKYTYEH